MSVLAGATARTVPWPIYTGPQRRGRARSVVASRLPLHMPGSSLDYAVDVGDWLDDGGNDVIGGVAGNVARLDGATAGMTDLSMLWVYSTGRKVVFFLQGGQPGASYAALIAVGTTQGRLQPVVALIDCAGIPTPPLLNTPSPGAPWPAAPQNVPATVGALGGVIVPLGSGLAVDVAGRLRLSTAGLPKDPTGLPVGALWDNAGSFNVVTP